MNPTLPVLTGRPRSGPRPLAVPPTLVLDSRISATERLVLISLTCDQPASDWCTGKTDDELVRLHGLTNARPVQRALLKGEAAGWILRLSPVALRAWLEQLGRLDLFDALLPSVRLCRRVIVLVDVLAELLDQPRATQVHLDPGGELATTVDPKTSAPRPGWRARQAPLACAPVSNSNDHDQENDDHHSHPDHEPHPESPEGVKARLLAIGLRNDLEAAQAPPSPPPRSRPAPPPSAPPTAPTPKRLPYQARRHALELVRQLGGDRADQATDSLVMLVATEFGVPAADLETLAFWDRSIRRFGVSEGGRVALSEILGATFGGPIRERAHYLSSCLAREHRAWGAQKTGSRATRQCPPEAGRVRGSATLNNCTRRVNP